MPTTDDLDVRVAAAAKVLAAGPPVVRPTPAAIIERASSDSVPYAAAAGPRRPGRLVAALAAAAVVVVAAVSLATVGRDDPGTRTTPGPSAPSTTVPSPYETGRYPAFSAGGEPAAVVEAYLRARFPDFSTQGIRLGNVAVDAVDATARWSTNELDGRIIAQGTIVLRRGPTQWSVVRATTDGVTIAVTIVDGRLQGRVTSSTNDVLAIDVVGPGGSPVPGSGAPLGGIDAAHSFGSAGIDDGRPDRRKGWVDVDLPAADGPIAVRARLVGGTALSISEVVLDTTSAGTVVDRGEWKGGTWALVTAASVKGVVGGPCAWIEVNGFRGARSCVAAGSPPRSVVEAATFEGESLYFAHVGADARTVRLARSDRSSVEVATVADPRDPDGARLAVVRIPTGEAPAVSLLDAAGQPIPTAPPAVRYPAAYDVLDAALSLATHQGVTTLDVQLRARPAGSAVWLIVLVDGREHGATNPLIVGSTFASHVELEKAERVEVVATDDSGTVVAAVGADVATLRAGS